ncbi:thioredoxin family protein [Ornithinimicrobium sediminis]|uniref:thioredoxin family protein n=1 Tax=Ornithinimicrobium sediminis TaxID=2904603 RepID=UPI001E38E04D|nr:thioredoxin family protein [Ornithinimicrobium sediminis]MCE0486916.1 thioredoxin family protein [Ornithinimicrobium sediminis]
MRTTLISLAVAALALTACGTDDDTTPGATGTPQPTSEEDLGDSDMGTEDMGTGSGEGPPAALPAGAYIDHATYAADTAAHEDSTVVLFFHADWCPSCRATDAALTEDGVPEGLTVVKVDFDSQTSLRQEYGIVQQHSFVHVDALGTALATWSGSPDGEDILARTG